MTQFRLQVEDFLRGSTALGIAMVMDAGDVLSNARVQKSIFGELLMGHALESLFIHALRPGEHIVSNGLFVEVAIGFLIAEDVPDSTSSLRAMATTDFLGCLIFFIRSY